MKKKSLLLFTFFIFTLSFEINAIDFSKNENYYQKLCSTSSGYNANKNTCKSFKKYLSDKSKENDDLSKQINKEIGNTKKKIQDIQGTIKKNDKLIKNKSKEIKTIDSDIKEKEKQITKFEEEVLSRLALLQEISGENFVIDFLMNSTSLDDFLTKMDGINAINDSNNQLIIDLDELRTKLNQDKKDVAKEKKDLEKAKKNKQILLKDFRSQEAELFKSLENAHKNKSIYNSKLDQINFNSKNGGVAEAKGWVRPLKSATITGTSWYYPASFGGGWHPAIDMAASPGSKIVSPGNGVVLLRGNYGNSGYGIYQVTAHQKGKDTYTFIYAHQNGLANVGSTIKQGQTIGYVGSTGNSTGPHLHFEVFKHKNQSLKSVINKYKQNGDLYFGLGYTGTGNCNTVCRIKPQNFLGLKYGQSY